MQQYNTITSDTTARSMVSNSTRKAVRAIKRMTRCAEVENILPDFKDLKEISSIKSQRVRDHLASMMNCLDDA